MSLKDCMNRSVLGLSRSPIREFAAYAAGVRGCIDLTLGEPEFATPEGICLAAQKSIARGDTHYIENSGSEELRRQIASFEREHYGLSYDVNEIIVTAGATEALYLSLMGILEPGDEVIIPEPAFLLYKEIVHLCRGRVVPLDTRRTGFQLREEELEPLITGRTKAIILNSPNNPTGCVYDRKSLETVRQLVKGKPVFVICDDVYRQLHYGQEYHSFTEYTDEKDRILAVQSFSKPYAMTGWRMGYLMAEREVRDRIALLHQYTLVSTPSMFQDACIEALKTDPSEMVSEYRSRRDYAADRLRRMSFPFEKPAGAFYLFLDISRFGMDSVSFARQLLEENNVAVTPGIAFGADDHIRISYCCSREELKEGMDRIEQFALKRGKPEDAREKEDGR